MYNSSHVHHQSGHFMAQSSHIHHPIGNEHYSHTSYSNDGSGSYNTPVAVGMTSQYQLSSQNLPKLPVSGNLAPDGKDSMVSDDQNLSVPIFRSKQGSSVSSNDPVESDSSFEPKSKKRKTGPGPGPHTKASPVKSQKSGKGGRHQDEIRTVFKFENGQWLCPKCNKAVSPRATRMKQHFEKCCIITPSVATLVDTKLGNSSSPSTQKKSIPLPPLVAEAADPNYEESSDDSDINDYKSSKSSSKRLKARGVGVGRQKSDVWQFYEEREEGSYYCRKCGKRVSSKAHRLSQHLATACVDTPRYIASEMKKLGFSSTSSSLKDETRQHFEYRDGQWCCLKCGKNVSSSLEKMKKHLEVWCGVSGSFGGAVASLAPTSTGAGTSTPSPSTSKLPVAKTESVRINHQLGRFIYSSNLPFEVMQDPEFVQFVKMLRVNHKLPSPEDLGDSILTDVENEIQLDMEKSLKDKSVTLIQYGWSNIACDNSNISDRVPNSNRNGNFNSTSSASKSSILHSACQSSVNSKIDNNYSIPSNNVHTIIHALHNGKQSFFLNASQIYPEDVTPMNCIKLLNSAIESACSQYSCEVVGILTDHCKSALTFRESVQKSLPSLHVYDCYMHLLDSLGKELTDSNVINSVAKVQEYFNSRASDEGLNLGGTSIVIPDQRTWSSQPESLTSFLTNHSKYMDIVKNIDMQDQMDEKILAILENRELFSKVQELILVLVPLSEALAKLQNDTATIADAVSCWLALMNDPQISSSHKEIIRDTFTEGVTPMAIAAYLLHPVYRGQNMDSELQEVGRMWLLDRNPMFVVGQAALERADTQYFPSSFLNSIVAKQMAPAVWWENAGKWPAIPEGLMSLAISLMVLPASTSTVDQCSNTIAHILSVQKKILGLEKALKLCNAFFSLRRK